jgi:DNA-binding NarL/FixJ family response regulator
MPGCSIVLADDHVMVRQGLKRIVEASPGLEVVGEADDGLALLHLLRGIKPDLLVLDISMPHVRGIEAIHEAKAMHPDLKVLVLTMHREVHLLKAAIVAGASGYLLKEDADEELYAAIDAILHGRMYVSPRLAESLAVGWAETLRRDPLDDGAKDDLDRLTLREREVLKLTAEGRTSKEVGELLCISPRTVEHHRASLMNKLNLRSTAALIRFAIERGYV